MQGWVTGITWKDLSGYLIISRKEGVCIDYSTLWTNPTDNTVAIKQPMKQHLIKYQHILKNGQGELSPSTNTSL